MTYLARLAAQTGLIPAMPVAPPPEGLEVIEEQVLVSAPLPEPSLAAPLLPIVVSDQTARPQAPSPVIETVIEEIEIVAPPPAPETTVPPTPTPPQPVETPRGETPARQATEARPPTPDEAREIQLRQVLEWVSRNDRPAEPTGEETVPEAAEPELAPRTETAGPPRADPAVPPAIEIREIQSAPPPPGPWPAPPQADAVPEPRLPRQRAAPSAPPAPDDTHIVEERIDISIGEIHLDVTPPRLAASPAPPTPAPSAPMPRSPAPSSSRLSRRFIRM